MYNQHVQYMYIILYKYYTKSSYNIIHDYNNHIQHKCIGIHVHDNVHVKYSCAKKTISLACIYILSPVLIGSLLPMKRVNVRDDP